MLGGRCCMSVFGGSKRLLLTGTMLCNSKPCTVSVPESARRECAGAAISTQGHTPVLSGVTTKPGQRAGSRRVVR